MIHSSNYIFTIEWLDDTFFPTQKRLLTESLKTVTDALKDLSIPFILPEAGIFVMANFKKASILSFTRDANL